MVHETIYCKRGLKMNVSTANLVGELFTLPCELYRQTYQSLLEKLPIKSELRPTDSYMLDFPQVKKDVEVTFLPSQPDTRQHYSHHRLYSVYEWVSDLELRNPVEWRHTRPFELLVAATLLDFSQQTVLALANQKNDWHVATPVGLSSAIESSEYDHALRWVSPQSCYREGPNSIIMIAHRRN